MDHSNYNLLDTHYPYMSFPGMPLDWYHLRLLYHFEYVSLNLKRSFLLRFSFLIFLSWCQDL